MVHHSVTLDKELGLSFVDDHVGFFTFFQKIGNYDWEYLNCSMQQLLCGLLINCLAPDLSAWIHSKMSCWKNGMGIGYVINFFSP